MTLESQLCACAEDDEHLDKNEEDKDDEIDRKVAKKVRNILKRIKAIQVF
jgi:hypothetical protein